MEGVLRPQGLVHTSYLVFPGRRDAHIRIEQRGSGERELGGAGQQGSSVKALPSEASWDSWPLSPL